VLKLTKPKFRIQDESAFGGMLVLLSIWNRFDFSLLLTQCGIFKIRGLATWKLAFAFVASVVNNCTSDLKRVNFLSKDTVLKAVFKVEKISQSAMSRFLNDYTEWQKFTCLRVQRLQEDTAMALEEGDVVCLDDTIEPHPFADKIPFLAWLFDHSKKVYMQSLNLLATHAVKQNGREYPLFHSYWAKAEDVTATLTKFDLAVSQLKALRSVLPEKLRLWVSMDRWFFNKKFFAAVEDLNFDWVTKAKSNTVFYRQIPSNNPTVKPCYIRVTATELLQKVYQSLLAGDNKGIVFLPINDLYLKSSVPNLNARGKRKNHSVYKPIGAIAVINLTEDLTEENRAISQSPDETNATAVYKGAYLLVTNRTDAPEKAVVAYQKRWRIELLFRNSKQELGLCECHSTNKNHMEAHVALLFTAETLLRCAEWEQNENAVTEDILTHGQLIQLLFKTNCTVKHQVVKKSTLVHVYFDTTAQAVVRLFEKYWPRFIEMKWLNLSCCKLFPASD